MNTMQVLDEAAKVRMKASKPLWLMLSALCHDLGKAVVTAESGGALHAYAHEKEGIPLARTFLGRLTNQVKLTEYVLNMTLYHMEPNKLAENGAHPKAFMKLYDQSIHAEDLLLLAKADHLGRIGNETDREMLAEEYEKTERFLRQMLELYRERMSQPYVMGRDLIQAGVKPGPMLGEALSYAHKLRLAGIKKEDQLKQVLGTMREKSRKTGQADREREESTLS